MRTIPAVLTAVMVGASLSFLVAAPAQAATSYYVDARTGTGGDGSAGNPWRTLAQVSQANLGPGDRVLFARGDTWTGQLLIDDAGSATAPITVTGYGSAAAAAPTFTNPGPRNAIKVTGSYVVLDDLLVADADYGYSTLFGAGPQDSGGAIHFGRASHHNVVRNSEITGVGEGVKLFGSNHLVTNNYIHDLRMAFEGFDPMFGDTSYGAIGVGIKGPRNEVSYNAFEDCQAPSGAYGVDGGAIEVEGIGEPARNNIGTNIHHNRSVRSAGFIENDATDSFVESTVAYNVSDDYQSFMLLFYDADVDIVNNTVVRDQVYPGGSTNTVFRFPGDVSEIQLINNVFAVGNGLQVLSGGNPRHVNNLYWNSQSGADPVGRALGSGELVANPQLLNLAGDDFRPGSGSPVINRGASFGLTSDYDGHPVPVGSAVDIGAYERPGSSTTTTVVRDRGFEGQTSASLASPWTRSGGGTAGVDYQAQKARAGANNAWLNNSATGWAALNQSVTLLPNKNYVLRGYIRSSGNFGQRGYFGISGGGIKSEESFGSTGSYIDGYRLVTRSFNSGPGGAATVYLGIDGGASTGSWVQLDDVSVTP